MLERARGCLEHNGRRLLRLRSDHVKTQRLHYAFWSHGAGDIEVPAWWTDLLSRSAQEEKEEANTIAETTRQYMKAGFSGGHFLDFLYPTKTRTLMDKLNRELALDQSHRQKPMSVIRHYANTSSQQAQNVADHEVVLPEATSTKHDFPDNVTVEARLEQLYQRLTRYKAKLGNYEDTLHNLEAVDPGLKDRQSMNEAQAVAYELATTLNSVTSLSESLAADYLYDRKGTAVWTSKDWSLILKIHLRRRSLRSTRFLEAFDTALMQGRANFLMPIVMEEIIDDKRGNGNHRFRGAHELYARYSRWRDNASSEVQNLTRPFWDYAPPGETHPNLFTILRFFQRLQLMAPPKNNKNSILSAPEMTNTFIGLAKIIIDHDGFQKLDGYEVLNFFNGLSRIVRQGPAPYESMVDLLKSVLFRRLKGNKRLYADTHASQLSEALEIHGGYRGERQRGLPDLERKLFFRLTYANLSVEAEKVWQRLRHRHMDRVDDYERIRHQLARRGDVDGLHREEKALAASEAQLQSRDPERYERVKPSPLTIYKYRLEAHRRRNEVKNMLTIFKELQDDPKVGPDYFVYCQMISGHARSNDLAGADDFFMQMVDAEIKPGIEAYAPILQALARQGDIDTIRDITSTLENSNIEINDWVVNSHVFAYLQRGELGSAEALVWKALTFKLEDRTKMWNYIILHWALKGHRRKVNLLMHQMKRNNVPFDAFTFAARMQMWIIYGQPQRAWLILKSTMPRLGLRPLPFHYALVIRGLAKHKPQYKAKKFRKVHRKFIGDAYRHMLSLGLRPDWNVRVALSDALLENQKLSTSGRALRYLKNLLAEADLKDATSTPLLMSKNVGDQYEVFSTGLFDFIFRLSRRQHHLARFDSVWQAYVDYVANTGPRPFSPPLRIILRLMLLFRRQKAWGEVRKCWESIRSKADDLAKLKGGTLVAARRSILAGPLHSYMMCLHQEGTNVEEVKELIASLLKDGYALDNRCWNLYTRLLCVSSARNYLLALETAEEQLIHGLTRWPRIMEPEKRDPPETMAILQRGLKRRESTTSAFRTRGKPHFPFRLETSIGKRFPPLNQERNDREYMASEVLAESGPWDEMNDPGEGPAIDLESFDKEENQQRLDRDFAQAAIDARYPRHEHFDPLSGHGLTTVTSWLDQGGMLRRPEYSTIVYLAGIYLDIRKRVAFDPEGAALVKEIHQKCPRLVKMILKLPRNKDRIQQDWLQVR